MLSNIQVTEKQASRYFAYFILGHLIIWTLLQWLVSPNLPLDVAEGYAWGQEYLLGTYKHPPMPSWWLQITALLTGHASFAHFLDSQIAIVIAFWAVWDLSKRFVSPLGALAAVLLLEAVPYYNFLSSEFNHNVLLVCFWALIIRSFYLAATTNLLRHWLLFGVWIAAGMYSKYFTAVLLVVLVIFSLVHPLSRQRFKSFGPYLAVAVSLILFAPHLVWLVQHHFLPIVYTESRLDETVKATFFLKESAKFTLTQIAMLLPMLLIAYGLLKPKKAGAVSGTDVPQTSSFDRSFLLVINLGPWLVICLISIFLNASLKDMWGMPLWNFAGLWLVYALCAQLTQLKKSFVAGWGIWVLVIAVLYAVTTFGHPYFKSSIKRVQFPGSAMAAAIDQQWQHLYHTPLPYSIGETWVSGNLSYYAPSHPTPFTDNNPLISHWVNVDDVKKRGGVFLSWRCSSVCTQAQSDQQEKAFADRVRAAYPDAIMQTPLSLKPQTASTKPLPVIIDWAIIPPEANHD